MGADLGFVFRYTDDSRMANTFRAPAPDAEILGGLTAPATDPAMARAAGDLDAVAALARDLAAELGLDRDAALLTIAPGTHADEVRAHEQFWTARGIQGVPGIVFDGRYLVIGAQDVDIYRDVLRQVETNRAA